MKRFFARCSGLLTCLVFTTTFGFFSVPAAAEVQDFVIQSFEADYFLEREPNKTSKLRVVETIVAEFPQTDQNHGILRAIPETYQDHNIHLTIERVTDGSGKELPYSTETSNDNKVLRIGDPDTYAHGKQTYKISYTMRSVTHKPANAEHDEFYWDVNGTQWSQPFQKVVARLHLSPELASALSSERACYTGRSGSTEQACTFSVVEHANETVISAETTRPFEGYENLTIAIAFSKDTFAAYQPSLADIWQMIAPYVLIGLPPIIALFVVVRNWLRAGRDPKGRGVIVPEYLPPKAVGVLGASAVLREKYVHKAFSAQVIDLAVRGYLKIYEKTEKKLMDKQTKYELELIKTGRFARREEQGVIALLFGDKARAGTRVQLDSLSKTLYHEASKLGTAVTEEMALAGYFAKDPNKARTPYFIAGGLLLVAGFLTITLFVGIGFLIASVIAFIGAAIMPARTQKGVELRSYLLGLKQYMKLAEAERLKVLQSPHGKLTEKIDAQDRGQLVKLYERLLPYAMLFDIEREWAKTLAPLYEQPPKWYAGAPFQPALFAASVVNFTGAANQSFALPGSSGGAGAGGGGGSGGGGGGGGGGGW